MNINEIIQAARGDKAVDFVLANARIVNVFSGEIVSGNIAVSDGYIVGFPDSQTDYPAKKIIDLNGKFVAPGFIDSHVHIESSMVCITEFARAVLPRGTTTVVADPHEIANVLGTEGIRYMLKSAEQQPMNILFTLPSCVPATHMETAGATLLKDDLAPFMEEERIMALAEMMNYPGVIFRSPEVLAKINLAKAARKPVDGHAPMLTGHDLYEYIAAGVSSDHECTSIQEAKEKLMAGMYIMIREGTGAKNLKELLPLVNEKTFHRMMWCTDDRHPHDLMEQGHIDSIIRDAIRSGVDPIMAIQMATLIPAQYFGIQDAGAIAPGKRADLVILSDMDTISIEQVYSHGVLVAENGTISPEIGKPAAVNIPVSMNIKSIKDVDFSIPAEGKRARVIEIVPNQIITRQSVMDVKIEANMAVSDISRDMLKIAVVERYTGKADTGKGFVKGFGLKRGALASSVAHDSHNIILVGTHDSDMKAALACVAEMGGGLAAVCDGKVHAKLPLPIAGLMSYESVETVRSELDQLLRAAREFGSILTDPFMTMAFLALPVIPELKITDKGLVDVGQFKEVGLFV